jgi:ArsR family transcriptional regulator
MRELALFYAALADKNRLRLLHAMRDGEICVCFLQGVLQTNQPKVSRHLAYLKRAGLVKSRRQGKWMHYRLSELPAPLRKILLQTLDCLRTEPEIKKDGERLKQISCCPSRYGLADPGRKCE